ncbi:hypothetical protein ACLMJK_000492 [Lecanora helva]
MDPVSFTASLVTLTGAVAATSEFVLKLRASLKNVPDNVENLFEQIGSFRNLLDETKAEVDRYRNVTSLHETLPQRWASLTARMQRDIDELENSVRKLQPLLNKNSTGSRIALRIHHLLSEEQIVEYRGRLQFHCDNLVIMRGYVCSRKLDQLSALIKTFGTQHRDSLQALSTQLSQSTVQAREESISGFSRQWDHLNNLELANEGRHERTIAYMDDQTELSLREFRVISEKQERAIGMTGAMHRRLTSGFSSNQTALEQVGNAIGQLNQSLMRQAGTHFNAGSRGQGLASARYNQITAYLASRSIHLPCGSLRFERTQMSKSSGKGVSTDHTESAIRFTFIPPSWLSNMAIESCITLDSMPVASQWHLGSRLKPFTVNTNPLFLHLVKKWDVVGLQKAFASGLAGPNDYISYKHDYVPWFAKYLTHGQVGKIDEVDRTHLLRSLSDLLIGGDRPCLEPFLWDFQGSIVASDMSFKAWTQIVERYSRGSYRQSLVRLRTPQSFWICQDSARDPSMMDWVPSTTRHLSEPLMIEDLSPIAVCVLGAVACEDLGFRNSLKEHVGAFHSAFNSDRTEYMDRLFNSAFSAESVLRNFNELNAFDKSRLLWKLYVSGLKETFKLLVSRGCVDELCFRADSFRHPTPYLLGYVATLGDSDVFHMLLKTGANGLVAVPSLLHGSQNLPDAQFKYFLELLMKSSWPVLGLDWYDDPLLAIITSQRALSLYHQAPEILFKDNPDYLARFLGNEHLLPSYMYHAITCELSSLLELVLQREIDAEAQISFPYVCSSCKCVARCVTSFTWLTLATMIGSASSVKILINSGAQLTTPDGYRRSPTKLATKNAYGAHPRYVWLCKVFDKLLDKPYKVPVTADEDAQVLEIIKRVFDEKYHGRISMEDYVTSEGENNLQRLIDQMAKNEEPQSVLNQLLGIFLRRDHIRDLEISFIYYKWRIDELRSLSHLDSLLIRFFYVFSLLLLPILVTAEILKGQRPIPVFPRGTTTTIIVLLLALIWGSSHFGFEVLRW